MREKKALKPKTKKFFYRRAKWDGQTSSPTLEQALVIAHSRLPTTATRTFQQASGNEIQGARIDHNRYGFFLQVASYTPDEPTSTIAKSRSGTSAVIGAEPAPHGKDYLDGDVFILVKGNDVLLCPSRVRETVAGQYFYRALQASRRTIPIVPSLSLDPVARENKIQMINREGVKEIKLMTSLYEASLVDMEAKEKKVSGLKAAIADHLQRLFEQDRDLKEIKESENLNVEISIKFDGKEARRKQHKESAFGVAGKRRLAATSKQMVKELEEGEEPDGFVIITGSGSQITSSNVRVFEKYSVATLGKSLDHQDAWNKLIEYYDHLRTSGALSQ